MAHIKSIVVGKGSFGSIGDITVRTVGGSVIASQKVSRKAGLGTLRQVMHQVKIANIVRGFSELNASAPNGKGMAQSFPDRPSNCNNCNMFVRANFGIPEVAAVAQTKEEAAGDLLVPAPFVVSRGTLSPVAPYFTLQQENPATSVEAAIITPAVLTITSTTTYGEFCSALMAVMHELRQGDALTFFVMAFKNTGTPNTKMFAVQMIMDAASSDPLTSFTDLIIETASGHAAININDTLGVSGVTYDIAPVLGRNTPGGYAVCDAQFTTNCLSCEAYTTHTSAAKEMDAALSYGFREDPFLQNTL